MKEYFRYGDKETEYLKSRDSQLGKVIDRMGFIKREVIPDLYKGLVYNIIGQQISMKAAETVWNRFTDKYGEITPETLYGADINEMQKLGISMRKAGYIRQISERVLNKSLSVDELYELPDGEVIRRLSSLPGIGVWTAEMLMIFSMQRKDILSKGDLGIKRGMMILYGLDTVTNEQFEFYRKIYSPYGSVASLYLWEVAKNI